MKKTFSPQGKAFQEISFNKRERKIFTKRFNFKVKVIKIKSGL